jgi:hypothetical protein
MCASPLNRRNNKKLLGQGRFGVTVAAKARVRVLFIAERLLRLKISLLSNYPNAAAI